MQGIDEREMTERLTNTVKKMDGLMNKIRTVKNPEYLSTYYTLEYEYDEQGYIKTLTLIIDYNFNSEIIKYEFTYLD